MEVKKESKKLDDLKFTFEVNSKTEVIKKLINESKRIKYDRERMVHYLPLLKFIEEHKDKFDYYLLEEKNKSKKRNEIREKK